MSAFWLVVWFATADASTTVEQFMTDTPPRVDPVFPDPFTLRKSIDEFLELQGEMQRVRDAFATSIHQTLAKLPSKRAANKACPDGVGDMFRRAYDAGTLYLKLGHKFRELYREIGRAEALGDAIALTPDYRLKAKRAGQVFAGLVRDYREMRVAFHDQLATELRFAGCSPQALLGPKAFVAANGPREADAGDPEAWDLEATPPDDGEVPPMKPKGRAALPTTSAPAASSVWVNVDNAKCASPTRLWVDGMPMGDIPPKRRVAVRARAGTHELCLLPEGDSRVCGEKGTVRRTYLYEGLTLTVHCEAQP